MKRSIYLIFITFRIAKHPYKYNPVKTNPKQKIGVEVGDVESCKIETHNLVSISKYKSKEGR